jgi:hypothetical protein
MSRPHRFVTEPDQHMQDALSKRRLAGRGHAPSSLGRNFDGLIARDIFFHLTFEDRRRMFALFRAHSKPGTALMFTRGPAHGEAVGVFVGEPSITAASARANIEPSLRNTALRLSPTRLKTRPAATTRSGWLNGTDANRPAAIKKPATRPASSFSCGVAFRRRCARSKSCQSDR